MAGFILPQLFTAMCLPPTLTQNAGGTISGAGLIFTGTAGAVWYEARANVAVSSGKWQWETDATNISTTESWISGIKATSGTLGSTAWYNAGYTNGACFGVMDNSVKVYAAASGAFASSIANGSVVTHLLDLDAGTYILKKDGTSLGTMFSGISGEFAPACQMYSSSAITYRFRSLTHPETGYSDLCAVA